MAQIRYTPPVPPSLQSGDIVERYRVESTLGEGGTARVYRVRHTTLDTVHALKVLTIDHPKIRDRLIAEGKAQATLNHPNLVPVRDVLSVNGAPALLMDFVPGVSLSTHLASSLPHPREALRLFSHIVAGVAYAHSRGLIHRDLKPANVLIDLSTKPVVPLVTDFGLVRFLNPPKGETRRTAVGVMMGTFGYMAPEQLRDSHTADERTDVFSLGALLYCMATGEPPFASKDQLEVMNATAEGRYIRLRDRLGMQFDEQFDTIVERCLQVNPDRRYKNAGELLEAITLLPTPNDPNATLNWALDDTPPLSQQASSRIHDAATVYPQPTPSGEDTAALIVDNSGKGHLVHLTVQINPNAEGIVPPPNVSRDAAMAAQVAASVALGNAASHCEIRWGFRDFIGDVRGTSLGLPLAVAIWCAANGKSLPANLAFSGGVDMDGSVAPVSGIPAKLRAAVGAGMTAAYVPAEGLGQLDRPAGLDVQPVRSFEAVIASIFGSHNTTVRRPWRWEFAVLLIPFVMALTGLSSRIEPLMVDPILRATHGPLKADNTAIVAFEPQRDARALRSRHAATIDALVAGGAKAIFFDVILLAETEHDPSIAAAIRRAFDAGVPVILPLMTENEAVLYPESDELRDAAWFGAVLAQTDTTFWQVRRAPMRLYSLAGDEVWHAAAQTVRAHLGVDDPPMIADGQLVIGPSRNPVWADVTYLHPSEPTPVVSYEDPGSFNMVRGRSVLVGEMGGADDVHRIDSGAVYGVEIEAALIETLLQQRAPRIASPEVNSAWALFVGLCTALLGLALPPSRRRLAWVVPASALAICVALITAGILVAAVPMLVSSVLGIWIATRTHPETYRDRHPLMRAS